MLSSIIRRLSGTAFGNGRAESEHAEKNARDFGENDEKPNVHELLAAMQNNIGEVERRRVRASDFSDTESGEKLHEFYTQLDEKLSERLGIDTTCVQETFTDLVEYLFMRCGMSDAKHNYTNEQLAQAVSSAAIIFLVSNPTLEKFILDQIRGAFYFPDYCEDDKLFLLTRKSFDDNEVNSYSSNMNTGSRRDSHRFSYKRIQSFDARLSVKLTAADAATREEATEKRAELKEHDKQADQSDKKKRPFKKEKIEQIEQVMRLIEKARKVLAFSEATEQQVAYALVVLLAYRHEMLNEEVRSIDNIKSKFPIFAYACDTLKDIYIFQYEKITSEQADNSVVVKVFDEPIEMSTDNDEELIFRALKKGWKVLINKSGGTKADQDRAVNLNNRVGKAIKDARFGLPHGANALDLLERDPSEFEKMLTITAPVAAASFAAPAAAAAPASESAISLVASLTLENSYKAESGYYSDESKSVDGQASHPIPNNLGTPLAAPARHQEKMQLPPPSPERTGDVNRKLFNNDSPNRKAASTNHSSTSSRPPMPVTETRKSPSSRAESVTFSSQASAAAPSYVNMSIPNLITCYYSHQGDHKSQVLNALIEGVLQLCDLSLDPDLKLGLNVRAPVAINALIKLHNQATTMDVVYPYFYTVLQAVLATEKNNLVKKENAKKARAVITQAKDILQSLANAQKGNDALKEVHDRMVTNGCGNIPAAEKLAQFDTSDSAYMSNLSSKKAQEMFRELPFSWGRYYLKGADEDCNFIFEQRRHLEAIAAWALKAIGQKCQGGESLSLQEQWLLATAITDYEDARDRLKRHPKQRILAVSPFYNAIKLIAIEEKTVDEEVSDQFYNDFIQNYIAVKASSLKQQNLQEKLEARAALILKRVVDEIPLESPSQTSSVSRTSISLSRSNTNTNCTAEETSMASDHSGSTFGLKKIMAIQETWTKLNRQYGSEEAKLDQKAIITIFKRFDLIYHAAAESERPGLQLLLIKAFDAMIALFNDEHLQHSRYYFFTIYQGVPVDFKDFMQAIAPKANSGLPAYTFALFCAYKVKKGGSLYRYEADFIRKHIAHLYPRFSSDPQADALNKMTYEGNRVRDYVAPVAGQTSEFEGIKKSAIGMIYEHLNSDLKKLEAKKLSGTLTEKDLDPYRHLTCVSASELSDRATVAQRVTTLIEATEKQIRFTYSGRT